MTPSSVEPGPSANPLGNPPSSPLGNLPVGEPTRDRAADPSGSCAGPSGPSGPSEKLDSTNRAMAAEINALVKEIWVAIEREAKDYDEPSLTSQQHVILDLVVTRPSIAASEIASTLNVTRGAVSQHLAVLEGQKYIKREPSSEDARRQTIELDQRGLKYEERMQAFEQRSQDRYLTHFSKQDLDEVVLALQKLKGIF